MVESTRFPGVDNDDKSFCRCGPWCFAKYTDKGKVYPLTLLDNILHKSIRFSKVRIRQMYVFVTVTILKSNDTKVGFFSSLLV